MKCATSDKLEQWFDGFVQDHEYKSIQTHLKTCQECQQIIEMYSNEEQFIKETLGTPTLPDDFANHVLSELEPYAPKQKRKKWKRMTTKFVLDDKKTSENGVGIQLKEVQFAPSSNEILYDTYFTAEEQAKVEAQIQMLEDSFGKENVYSLTGYGTAIQYHIENKEGETLYHHNTFQDQGHPSDGGLLQGMGQDTEKLGYIEWNESFVPQRKEEQLTFVLDGVVKTVPSDFSIKIKPKELKKVPLSFEYEGNFNTIKKVREQNKFSLRKAFPPIEMEQIVEIEMEGGKEVPSATLGAWVLVDEKGEIYEALHSGAILDEKDKNGRFKTNTTLSIYGLKEVPEEFTLHLLSVTRYEEVEKEWRVPLYKE